MTLTKEGGRGPRVAGGSVNLNWPISQDASKQAPLTLFITGIGHRRKLERCIINKEQKTKRT